MMLSLSTLWATALAEVGIGEPLQLGRLHECLVVVGVLAAVLVEGQEGGAEIRPLPVQGEVLGGLFRFQHRVLVARDAEDVGLAGLEFEHRGGDVLHHQVDDLIQIGQGIAGVVLLPVMRVLAQHDALADVVPFNGERPRADDLAGVGAHVPSRGEAAVINVFFQNVLGINGGAHRAQERRERHGQGEANGMVVDLGDLDLSALPLLRGLVDVTDSQARPRRGGDIVVVDDALEGEKHVVGRERRAVGPFDALAQEERPHQAVVGRFPALGQIPFHLRGQPRGLGQPLEQVAENFGGRRFR